MAATILAAAPRAAIPNTRLAKARARRSISYEARVRGALKEAFSMPEFDLHLSFVRECLPNVAEQDARRVAALDQREMVAQVMELKFGRARSDTFRRQFSVPRLEQMPRRSLSRATVARVAA